MKKWILAIFLFWTISTYAKIDVRLSLLPPQPEIRSEEIISKAALFNEMEVFDHCFKFKDAKLRTMENRLVFRESRCILKILKLDSLAYDVVASLVVKTKDAKYKWRECDSDSNMLGYTVNLKNPIYLCPRNIKSNISNVLASSSFKNLDDLSQQEMRQYLYKSLLIYTIMHEALHAIGYRHGIAMYQRHELIFSSINLTPIYLSHGNSLKMNRAVFKAFKL
jgi:hypothetical protein